MTISSDSATTALLAEYATFLDSDSARAALLKFIEHARSDTRYKFLPRKQGSLERTVQYMVGHAWAYGFIVNKADLLFYYRKPSDRVSEVALDGLLARGMMAKRNPAGEITVRIRSIDDAGAILADCFDDATSLLESQPPERERERELEFPLNFPRYAELVLPLLRLIFERGGRDYEMRASDTYGPLAESFGLSPADRVVTRNDVSRDGNSTPV